MTTKVKRITREQAIELQSAGIFVMYDNTETGSERGYIKRLRDGLYNKGGTHHRFTQLDMISWSDDMVYLTFVEEDGGET